MEFPAKISVDTPLSYQKVSKRVEIDKKTFKVCQIKEEVIGKIKKSFLFIHFDGKQWKILLLPSDLAKIKDPSEIPYFIIQ